VAVYRRSARQRFTLVLLVLLSVTILTLDYRGQGSGVVDAVKDGAQDAFAPVQGLAQALFRPVGNVFNGVFRYDDLEAENARLRQQLEEAEGATLQARDAERQLQALLDVNGLQSVGDIPSVAARVVSTSPSNFEQALVLDQGTDDGVAVGMPVVAGAGLVGRVVDASRSRSTVLLLTDPSFRVGVRFLNDDVAVAQGEGPGTALTVDLVEPSTPVDKGDPVFTSGLQQSLFPAGIPVGTVRRAQATPGALRQRVSIDPVVDIGRLRFVKVLQWNSGSAP
jgi:rod shape-determining protein MreC